MKKRLEKTIERLKREFNTPDLSYGFDQKMEKIIQVLENRNMPEYLNLIKVRSGSNLRFVPISQIIFFKADDKYTVVQTPENEFLIKTPIKTLENRLDPKKFWRVHRSAIVNIERIQIIKRSFTNQMIIGFDKIDHNIAVSRYYEHLFK